MKDHRDSPGFAIASVHLRRGFVPELAWILVGAMTLLSWAGHVFGVGDAPATGFANLVAVSGLLALLVSGPVAWGSVGRREEGVPLYSVLAGVAMTAALVGGLFAFLRYGASPELLFSVSSLVASQAALLAVTSFAAPRIGVLRMFAGTIGVFTAASILVGIGSRSWPISVQLLVLSYGSGIVAVALIIGMARAGWRPDATGFWRHPPGGWPGLVGGMLVGGAFWATVVLNRVFGRGEHLVEGQLWSGRADVSVWGSLLLLGIGTAVSQRQLAVRFLPACEDFFRLAPGRGTVFAIRESRRRLEREVWRGAGDIVAMQGAVSVGIAAATGMASREFGAFVVDGTAFACLVAAMLSLSILFYALKILAIAGERQFALTVSAVYFLCALVLGVVVMFFRENLFGLGLAGAGFVAAGTAFFHLRGVFADWDYRAFQQAHGSDPGRKESRKAVAEPGF